MKTLRPPKYTYLKDCIYYFSRAIPVDLRHHYSRRRVIKSLRTKSHNHAKISANNLSTKLEEYWFSLRLNEIEVPRGDLLVEGSIHDSYLPTINEVLEKYRDVKGKSKDQMHCAVLLN